MSHDPLPRCFLTDEPGVGGRIKRHPDDFLVDEIELTEPSDSGEHLYLRVRSVNLAHGRVVSMLARHFGVDSRRVGYAGMKDKRSVSSQAFTVQTDRDYDGEPIGEGLDVLWSTRHHRKLRRGHLAGNRFSIRIREVEPLKAPQVARVLRLLEERGVPNFFGPQRFGYRRNNHLVGAMLLRREWKALLDELLGPDGSQWPAHQQAARAAYGDATRQADSSLEDGESDNPPTAQQTSLLREALRRFGRGAEAESYALRALIAGRSHRDAVMSVGRSALGFWANATQSAVFNRVLEERLLRGRFDALEPGDLAWKHDARAVFRVDAALAADPETARRLRDTEISPSGPLWGGGMIRAEGEPDERELAALRAFGLDLDLFEKPPCRLNGMRRPLRVSIHNTQVDSGLDERGPYVRVAFDLPRGAYATVVLREVMKRDDLEAPMDDDSIELRRASQ